MRSSESLLEKKARSAYERGRARFALGRTALLLPLVFVLPLFGPERWVAAAAGLLLLPTAFGLLYKGGVHAQALLPGLAAGAIAWALPSLPRSATHVCSAGVCAVLCIGGAVSGGVVAGLVLAFRARALPGGREAFLLSAAWVAFLLGISGCIVAGGYGVVGMVLGFLAGTMPVLVPHRS